MMILSFSFFSHIVLAAQDDLRNNLVKKKMKKKDLAEGTVLLSWQPFAEEYQRSSCFLNAFWGHSGNVRLPLTLINF